MKNKKGNVAVIAIIVVVVAITAGLIGWMFAKKSLAPVQQQAAATPTVAPQATVPGPNQAQDTVYVNSEYGFQLTLPKGWKNYKTRVGKNQTLSIQPTEEKCTDCEIIIFSLPTSDRTWGEENGLATVLLLEVGRSDSSRMSSGIEKVFIGKNDKYTVIMNPPQALPEDLQSIFPSDFDYQKYFQENFKPFNLDSRVQPVNTTSTLCTTPPEGTDIGRNVYPIDSKYKGIEFLGQLFTAFNCGSARTSKIFGVDGNNYTLGSIIWLKSNPSESLIGTFKFIGFKCRESNIDANCKEWQLLDTVKIDVLMKLEPYHENFEADDCTICG